MIALGFPDFSLRDHDLDAPCPETRWPNMLLLSRDRELFWPEHTAPLCVMSNFGGRSRYQVGSNNFCLDDTRYLVLNQGQRFSASIESNVPVESLNLWFRPDFAEEALAACSLPEDRLLEDLECRNPLPLHFIEQSRRHDDWISPLLIEVRDRLTRGAIDSEWEEGVFVRAAERLVRMHRGVAAEISRLPATRHATRVEIYRRLAIARDYIESNLERPLSLAEVARTACLSTFHFHRLFNQAFGTTPHHYATERRIERACHLLSTTPSTVADIAIEVGFQSATSFTSLFRRRHGTTPAAWRRERVSAANLAALVGEADSPKSKIE